MRTTTLRDRLDGLTNPLLVKEMYQSLHSRKFLMALWVVLGAALLTYVLAYEASDGKPCGDLMFGWFLGIMYLAGAVVLPFLAFANLYEEMRGRTVELVHITKMTSRKHVRGRWLASAAKVVLLFSVMGPFAVAAFLFRGIGVLPILFFLFLTLVLSLSACTVAIFFASVTAVKPLRSLARLLFYLALIGGVIFPLSQAFGIRGFFPFRSGDWKELGSALAVLTVNGVFVMWLLGAAAANILTFEADKCSSRTKAVLLLWLGALVPCGALISLIADGRVHAEALALSTMQASPILLACGVFWLTGPARVAQRIQNKLERRGGLYRLIMFPFVDGAGSSALYLLLVTGALCAILLATMSSTGSFDDWKRVLVMLVAFCVIYPFFYAALARGVVRLLPRKRRTANWVRGVLLCLIAVNLLVVIWSAAAGVDFDDVGASPVVALFPIVYVGRLARDWPGFGALFGELAIPALVGLGYHALAMVRHFERYVSGVYD